MPSAPPPRLSASLASVLSWIGSPVPPGALAAVLGPVDAAAAAACAAGWVLADERGWLGPHPYRDDAPGPVAAPEARAVVEAALADHPDVVSLQVAWLRVVGIGDGRAPDHPTVRARVSEWVARASFGLCSEVLRRELEEAGLMKPLLAAHRAPALCLLIDGGRAAVAASLLGDEDLLARAHLELHHVRPEAALALLAATTSTEGIFARVRAHRLRHDWAAVSAEIEALAPRLSRPFDRLRLAYYRHNVARLLGTVAESRAAAAALRAVLDGVADRALRGRALDSLVAHALQDGRVGEGRALLAELGAAWLPLEAPRATAQVTFRTIDIAGEVGDHEWLRARLERPADGGLGTQWHLLARAKWLTLTGGFKQALEIPEVERIGMLAAQLLLAIGRHEEALARADGCTAGYPDRQHAVIRNAIAARLGRGQRLEEHPDDTASVRSLLWRANGIVALAEGALAEAESHLRHALEITESEQLIDSAGELLTRLADVAVRDGRPAEAAALLDRFDKLGRHPHDFLVNRVHAARAVLAGDPGALPAGFVARVAAQEDAETLVLVERILPLDAAGAAVVARLAAPTRAQFAAAFVRVGAAPTLVVDTAARRVQLPGAGWLDMKRSGATWRVLLALARHRVAAPGAALDADALIAAGWPGERMQWESARTRLYTTMRRLRSKGLSALETVEGGYRLAPAWRVELG